MMVDWNGYRQQLVETIGKIARLSPETVKGYNTLSAAGTKTNHLDAKTRELIALAVVILFPICVSRLARGLLDNARAQCAARQCYGECARSRLCPPVDRTCRAFDRSRLSWAAVFSEPHVLCLGQANLRPFTATKSGAQSAYRNPCDESEPFT
jgi:hypothetical protein